MTMNEKKLQSIEKEIQKLTDRINKVTSRLEKKTALCVKLNCNWSDEEHREIMKQFYARHEGEQVIPFGNDDDLITEKQENAWFDRSVVESELEDLKDRLANAEKRFQKQEAVTIKEIKEAEEFKAEWEQANELERMYLSQKRIKEYEKWLAEFKAEMLQYGITIDEADASFVHGTTPNGKKFSFCINNGWTERSNHCYTLYIQGKGTIFTSGEWFTCLRTVKNS